MFKHVLFALTAMQIAAAVGCMELAYGWFFVGEGLNPWVSIPLALIELVGAYCTLNMGLQLHHSDREFDEAMKLHRESASMRQFVAKLPHHLDMKRR